MTGTKKTAFTKIIWSFWRQHQSAGHSKEGLELGRPGCQCRARLIAIAVQVCGSRCGAFNIVVLYDLLRHILLYILQLTELDPIGQLCRGQQCSC